MCNFSRIVPKRRAKLAKIKKDKGGRLSAVLVGFTLRGITEKKTNQGNNLSFLATRAKPG